MLTGMGIVYAFLALLVLAIKIMTAVVIRYFPETPAEFAPAVSSKSSEPLVIAAITAAVHQYRSQHHK